MQPMSRHGELGPAGRPSLRWIYGYIHVHGTHTRQLPFHQMPALPSPYCGRAKQRMATLPSHKAHVHALHAPPVRLDLDLDTLLHLGTSPTPDIDRSIDQRCRCRSHTSRINVFCFCNSLTADNMALFIRLPLGGANSENRIALSQ
jgi:hypothetical protein